MGLAPVLAGQDFTAAEVNQLPVVVSPMVLGSVANSTTETIIGTFSIPAGTITAINQGFRFLAACSCAATGSPVLNIRVRSGGLAGTIICSGSNNVTATGSWFTFDGWLLFNAVGAGGTFTSKATVDEAFGGAGSGASPAAADYLANAVAFNTTTPNTIVVTAQFAVANAANVAAGLSGGLYQL